MGVRKGRSAKGSLLRLTEKWKLAVDSGLTVGVVFIDFQKAFDTVSHDILAFKLQALGIAGDVFELIMSYLNNRHQYTELNGKNQKQKLQNMECHKDPYLDPDSLVYRSMICLSP